ncbi:MAG: S16 family serine protease [Rickettsiales bacterium]
MIQKINSINTIPVIALKTAIPYPNTIMSFLIQRPTSIRGLITLDKNKGNNTICLIAQKSEDDINYLYNIGVLANVIDIQYFNKNIKKQFNDSSKIELDEDKDCSAKENKSDNNKESEEEIFLKNNPDFGNVIVRIIVSCKDKVLVKKIENTKGYQELCQFEICETIIEDEEKLNIAILNLQNQFTKYAHTLENKLPHQKRIIDTTLKTVINQHNLEHKVNYIASYLYTIDHNSLEEKDNDQDKKSLIKGQIILEEPSLIKKIEMIIEDIKEKINTINIKTEIELSTEAELKQDYKKAILRKQLDVIRKMLGDQKDQVYNRFKLNLKFIDKKENPEAYNMIEAAVEKFANIQSYAQEYSSSIEWIELAFKAVFIEKKQYSVSNIQKIQESLDANHFGMQEVKKAIISFLVSRSHINKDADNLDSAPILCLAGAPGTGKTSIAKCIAEALNLPYYSIAMGGVRDEAVIRGHRKTYLGAMAGKIVTGATQMNSDIGLFILDEIDKIAPNNNGGVGGSVADALLETLDPKQNKSFVDHYLGFPIRLDKNMFIVTANYLDSIPPALRDRLEIINLPGYTTEEKINIVKKHTIKNLNKKYNFNFSNKDKILSDNSDGKTKLNNTSKTNESNFNSESNNAGLIFTDEIIRYVIENYTREAGVRSLTRKFEQIYRFAILEQELILANKAKENILYELTELVITKDLIREYLGTERSYDDLVNQEPEIGVVNGLAYSSVGGSVLQIECVKIHGSGQITITGNQGNVMKESAQVAKTVAINLLEKYKYNTSNLKELDIHIHVPDGSTPKDGPSAGITMLTAIFSCLSNIPVKAKIGMTGEITLTGKVTAIGGLKEKILAGIRQGIKIFILSEQNRKDFINLIKNEEKSLLIENNELNQNQTNSITHSNISEKTEVMNTAKKIEIIYAGEKIEVIYAENAKAVLDNALVKTLEMFSIENDSLNNTKLNQDTKKVIKPKKSSKE